MPTAQIECPQCNGRFTLKAPNFQIMVPKLFRCPKCGFSVPFGQLMASAAIPVQTMRSATPPAAPLHTNIAGAARPSAAGRKTSIESSAKLATLTVQDTGRKFNLSQGNYTIGRECSDSRASLQIAPDQYISRLQAQLQVVLSVNGQADCVVVGMAATNPIFVNNVRIAPGQAARLKNGDIILLGMTKVVINF